VQSHLTRGEAPSFGHVTVKLVEYGLARLLDENTGQIIEPLAFISLLKWLQTDKFENLSQNLRDRLAIPASRGFAYEELVVLYLLRTFRYPVPLNVIFDFHGTTPWWKSACAQIVGRLNGNHVPVDVLGEAPQNAGLGAVYFARSPEDIIKWLKCPDDTPSILIPTHLYGPDIMARFKVFVTSHDRSPIAIEVIAMGQLKSCTVGNKESLDAPTIAAAINTLNPSHWFESMKANAPDRRQRLIDELENHNILRFLGGYPLPPKLDLKATSVNQAIYTLDTDVPLAALNLYAFKAEFLQSHEFRDVLIPMDHAFDRKRKASEMDC
jgi:hypothetical protein